MREETLPDVESVARRTAQVIGATARDAIGSRGRFLLATSGGSTPWHMLRLLAAEDVHWACVRLFQVDERVVPPGHPDRNLTHLRASLLANLTVMPAGVHAMGVEAPDLERAAADYAATLRTEAGPRPVLDLIHLGLGDDGHTASLVPGDSALDVTNADVAVTGPYQGVRRMTLTFPALNRARAIVWMVTGAAKGAALARLRLGDRTIPAGRVQRDSALIVSDTSAHTVSLRP